MRTKWQKAHNIAIELAELNRSTVSLLEKRDALKTELASIEAKIAETKAKEAEKTAEYKSHPFGQPAKTKKKRDQGKPKEPPIEKSSDEGQKLRFGTAGEWPLTAPKPEEPAQKEGA